MIRIGTVFVAISAAVIAGCPASPPPTPVSCGAGTVERDGVCVALPPADDARCGEGTVLNTATNTCDPVVECGEGTVRDGDLCRPVAVCGDDTFFDEATGLCVPAARCAEGTTANSETRRCESPVTCGPGTALDVASRECRPLPACEPGTVLDAASGLCVGAITCGDGQVVINGLCVEPNQGIALEADVVEGVGENDPDLGGSPEALALEPIGERTVFVGGIDRPQDVNGDGAIDQDRDVWAFTGTAGDYLDIEVLSLGLPGPAFIVDGPRGYRRSSALATDTEPARELLLPYTGEYRITVVPGSFLLTGVPAGNLGNGYVGVIERRALPNLTPVTPGVDGITPATLTGGLFNLDDNMFRIAAPPRSAVAVTFRTVPGETAPALIAMTGDLKLLSEIDEVAPGEWAGIFTPAAGEAFFAIDWRDSVGPGDAYSVDVNFVPLVETGVLAADSTTTTGAVDVITQQTAAFQFIIDAPQLVTVDFLVAAGPDVQIVNEDGTFAIIDDDDLFFVFAQPGEYVVFGNNDAAGDDLQTALVLTTLTPIDLGTLTPGATTTATMSGPDLRDTAEGPREAWGVVTVPASTLLALDVTLQAGDPELAVFAVDGRPLRGLDRPQGGATLHVDAREETTALVLLDSAGQNTRGWRVDATVLPAPATLEREPNDSVNVATALPGAPVRVRGFLGDDEVDTYSLTLGDPLPEGKALRIQFDDLGVTAPGSGITNGTSLTVLDGNLQPLASIPTSDATVSSTSFAFEQGALGSTTKLFVGGFEGAGPFTIQLVKQFASTNADYILSVDVVDLQFEVEPNDGGGNVDVIALDRVVAGHRATADTIDVYELTLDQALEPGEALAVRWQNFETNNNSTVQLLDATDAVVAAAVRVSGLLRAPGLPAGTYRLTFTGAGALDPLYTFVASIDDGAFELEPNDIGVDADDLGVLGASAPLEIEARRTTDLDLFSFALAAPLSATQAIRVDVTNISDTATFSAELLSGSPDAGGTVLNSNVFDAASVVASPAGTGPFFVRVAGTTGEPDLYTVRVSVVDAVGELEPNGTTATATATTITDGAFRILGNLIRTSTTNSDVDVHRLTIDADGTLSLRWRNLTDTTAFRVRVLGADGTTELGNLSSATGRLDGIAVAAGSAFLEVTIAATSQDLYEIVGEVTP